MKQLAVNLEEDDLERLQALARSRHIDPKNMTKERLVVLLLATDAVREDHSSNLLERRRALVKMRELWRSAVGESIEGVEYQKTMRAEWP